MVRLLHGKIIFQSNDSLGRFDSIYGKLCERSRFFFSFSGWQSEMSICYTGFIMINSVKKKMVHDTTTTERSFIVLKGFVFSQ